MLDALQFVRGAVSRKDIVPALQHFRIHRGTIRSYNGTIGLNSPIACDLDIAPNAVQFVKAIEACIDGVSLSMWDGKLVVHGGPFRVFVDCVAGETFPDITPKGKSIKLDNTLLPALRYLEPFVAADASRPWACGILFENESAFATNNIVLQQYWLGFQFPMRVNIPTPAVRELIRIGVDPDRMQVEENNLTFHYKDGRWLTTRLLEAQWPVDVQGLLDNAFEGKSQWPFPEGFFDALDQLAPFTDELGRVYFHGDCMSTSANPNSVGATIQMEKLGLGTVPMTGCFNLAELRKLKEVIRAVDFSAYPQACTFTGEVTRGIIMGFVT